MSETSTTTTTKVVETLEERIEKIKADLIKKGILSADAKIVFEQHKNK